MGQHYHDIKTSVLSSEESDNDVKHIAYMHNVYDNDPSGIVCCALHRVKCRIGIPYSRTLRVRQMLSPTG